MKNIPPEKEFRYMVLSGKDALHRLSDFLHLSLWGGGIFAFFYFALHNNEVGASCSAVFIALLWLATEKKLWIFGDLERCRKVITSAEGKVERDEWGKDIADWEKNPQNPKNKK